MLRLPSDSLPPRRKRNPPRLFRPLYPSRRGPLALQTPVSSYPSGRAPGAGIMFLGKYFFANLNCTTPRDYPPTPPPNIPSFLDIFTTDYKTTHRFAKCLCCFARVRPFSGLWAVPCALPMSPVTLLPLPYRYVRRHHNLFAISLGSPAHSLNLLPSRVFR